MKIAHSNQQVKTFDYYEREVGLRGRVSLRICLFREILFYFSSSPCILDGKCLEKFNLPAHFKTPPNTQSYAERRKTKIVKTKNVKAFNLRLNCKKLLVPK